MVNQWRRPPAGQGIAFLQNRANQQARASQGVVQNIPNLLDMDEEEFVETMRSQGASEHMLELEIPKFRALLEERDERKIQRQQLRQRKLEREVLSPGLQKYVQIGKDRKVNAKRLREQEEERDREDGL